MTGMPRLYSSANFLKFSHEHVEKTNENFIENGCPRSFFLVFFTTQKALIITVGLQQLIQIERSPVV